MAEKQTKKPKPKTATHFIQEWRKHRRMTQEGLAAAIGQTSGAISQLENGVINYTQPTLEAIAAALGCRPGDLLNRAPEQGADTPEGRLRLAMLAYGVDRSQLELAVGVVSRFVAVGGRSEQNPSDDQLQPANRRHAKVP